MAPITQHSMIWVVQKWEKVRLRVTTGVKRGSTVLTVMTFRYNLKKPMFQISSLALVNLIISMRKFFRNPEFPGNTTTVQLWKLKRYTDLFLALSNSVEAEGIECVFKQISMCHQTINEQKNNQRTMTHWYFSWFDQILNNRQIQYTGHQSVETYANQPK